MPLTVKVGFETEVEVEDSASEELASSARTKAAASATVAPIAKRIVLACCLGQSRDLRRVEVERKLSAKKVGALPLLNKCGREAAIVSTSSGSGS